MRNEVQTEVQTNVNTNNITGLEANWYEVPVAPDLLEAVTKWQATSETLFVRERYAEVLMKLRHQWNVEHGKFDHCEANAGSEELLTPKVPQVDQLERKLRRSTSHLRVLSEADPVCAESTAEFLSNDTSEVFCRIVADGERLGFEHIKQLHKTLTCHQASEKFVDENGNVVDEFRPGGWKTFNNSVINGPESQLDFCEPQLVEEQLEWLIDLSEFYRVTELNPFVHAAWMFHRFQLIHPFQDGNGRVARCLASIILMREGWLPLIIRAQERAEYLEVSRSADRQDLQPLVSFIQDRQIRTLRSALAVGEAALSSC